MRLALLVTAMTVLAAGCTAKDIRDALKDNETEGAVVSPTVAATLATPPTPADVVPDEPVDGVVNGTAPADRDGDGTADADDAFPDDASESVDTDGDGVGDAADEFPNDPSEHADADVDGYGDNGDAFPHDASEWLDSDGDGSGDNTDQLPFDPEETKDADLDGIGDEGDVDDDNDGFFDDRDYAQGRNASITFVFSAINLTESPDTDDYGQVYFALFHDGEMLSRWPGEHDEPDNFPMAVGVPRELFDLEYRFDVPDDLRTFQISLKAFDEDAFNDDPLDIDGSSADYTLDFVFDVAQGTLSGDVESSSVGGHDGREDEKDAELVYGIILE